MVAAAPAASPQTLSKREASLFSRDTKLAADIVQTIMPKSASCTDAAAPDECSTASEAAPYLIQAMQDYKINTAPEIAAVLALVALESAELRYRRSISKNPGQGTSNMQQANFNAEYAASFPELSANLTAAGSDPDAILDLVTVDKYNFGSGPWFLVTHCSESVRVQLATTPDNGFAAT